VFLPEFFVERGLKTTVQVGGNSETAGLTIPVNYENLMISL